MLTVACFFLFFFAISVLYTVDLLSAWILCLSNNILIHLEVRKKSIFMSAGHFARIEVDDSALT